MQILEMKLNKNLTNNIFCAENNFYYAITDDF